MLDPTELNLLIQKAIESDGTQARMLDDKFYFQEAANLLKQLEEYPIDSFRKELEAFSQETLVNLKNKLAFKDQLDTYRNTFLYDFLLLVGKLIAVCDGHGYNRGEWNPYSDGRCVSNSGITQSKWTYCFVQYKLDNCSYIHVDTQQFKSIYFTIKFLKDPKHNVNISSIKHRELVCKYFELESDDDIIKLFPEYTSRVLNDDNRGVFIASILFSPDIKKLWVDEVIGLMVSDSTDWQDNFIANMKTYNTSIIWNANPPIGTSNTSKFLKDIIEQGKTFNIYYCVGNSVVYKANVIDFVENENEFEEKSWRSREEKILEYKDLFSSYVEGTKFAKIIFLIDSIQRIEPIPIDNFEFYKSSRQLRHGILYPISKEPEMDANKNKQLIDTQAPSYSIPLNQILFGAPGTGKTYHTINKALKIINEKEEQLLNWSDRTKVKELFDKRAAEGRIVFTTFHQSMNYEDFIEGIKPQLSDGEDERSLLYSIEPGIFKQICINAQTPNISNFELAYNKLIEELNNLQDDKKLKLTTPNKKEFSISANSRNNLNLYTGPNKKLGALTKTGIQEHLQGGFYYVWWKGYFQGVINYLKEKYKFNPDIPQNNSKNFVLIIDEINRGNISQIFGELITLIEEDKRLGRPEKLEVTLPYSKEKFGVPQNLYIVGTMNTADRSIEALDTALRRRFSFEEMAPKYDLKELQYEFAGIKVSELLKVINKRIEKLLDKDHAIGHSYFILSEKETPESKILSVFYKNIIPLLQEYFFGDYGKIGLVLGKGFIHCKEWNITTDSFADFDSESSNDFDDRDVYEIINYANPDTKYSIKIKKDNTENTVQMNFIKALKLLMKKDIE